MERPLVRRKRPWTLASDCHNLKIRSTLRDSHTFGLTARSFLSGVSQMVQESWDSRRVIPSISLGGCLTLFPFLVDPQCVGWWKDKNIIQPTVRRADQQEGTATINKDQDIRLCGGSIWSFS